MRIKIILPENQPLKKSDFFEKAIKKIIPLQHKIIEYIKRNRHGKIFFADEFGEFGSNEAVRQGHKFF